uniref:Putative ribulose-1,5 bisphosphate carboxylase/oxygenase large subunit N-methyltransferase, chloroplastic n=1 Tax=Anthurium amnicola TaxID=1678845 RepID=A0A1D1XHJ1_9ARAE
MADASAEGAKLERFLEWLQANGGQLRGCTIKHCGPSKGFGVFSSSDAGGGNGVLMVVPLDLAITPMRVLQDPSLGPRCAEMFKQGHVDDRFLMMLFLTVERLRRSSPWKPYIDMLPSTFNNPLWFTEDELSELKGTALYRATLLQKTKLHVLFEEKVKGLVEEILHLDEVDGGSDVQFEDFLWANSIFWTRALNIPFPQSYVFPSPVGEGTSSCCDDNLRALSAQVSNESSAHEIDDRTEAILLVAEREKSVEESSPVKAETVWVEGLIPGIDFCNHAETNMKIEKEICISYGNKGNEELLYLYGFVIENNPDDYLMVHYPIEAIQNVPLADSKAHLLEIQKAELRCLLPKSLLDHGFFSRNLIEDLDSNNSPVCPYNLYSWSGQRKVPPYLNKLIFPEEFLTALRTISLQEHELIQVSSLLEELVGSDEQRQPSGRDVQAAVWEASGDFGALQLLVDLLRTKMMELEESSGTEACDTELLERSHSLRNHEEKQRNSIKGQEKQMNRNHWSSVVYRQGQKRLTSLFLKEAEHALALCSSELS